MPWSWGAQPRQSTNVGGKTGSVGEASITRSWPNYDAAYLAMRLGAKNAAHAEINRFQTKTIDFESRLNEQVYLDKVAGDWKSEADECLKNEFQHWLEGRHASALRC